MSQVNASQVLKWQTLTAAVNEIRSPNQFLKSLLFSNHISVPTEDIEVGVVSRGREIAPFVRKNGEAIMVGGHSEKFQTVSAPNIRIKKPFTPSELLFNRRPGTVIFAGAGDIATALQQHVARDLKGMADMVTNAEEYLCAQALQGTISYEVTDEEVFTITFPRDSGNNITLSVFWNDATPANVRVAKDLHAVKRVMQEWGFQPTDCILGTEAADALIALAETDNIKFINTTSGVDGGAMTFAQQFSEDGVIYLGKLGGIRFWEYGRTATLDGVAKNMIRPKYAEFVQVGDSSERILYYGAIPDMDALEGQKFQGERFSKSWKVPDPSAMMALLHSRPLPVPRKVNATVSVKVVSG